MDTTATRRIVVEDIVRLRRRIEKSRIPAKIIDRNLIIAPGNQSFR